MPILRPRSIVDQVNTLLRQRVHDRVYPPGGRLPSESELAHELGVSRATVRTVLARMAAEGLILRKQGDGTYVNERIRDIDTRYGGMWDFSRLIESNGFRPAIETVTFERRAPARQEARALGLAGDAEVVALVRLFLADGRPAIFATNVIPAGLLRIGVDSADGQLPIHKFLQTYCGEEIKYAVSDIEATFAPPDLARRLTRDASLPILRLTEIFYNKNNRPLVFGLSYYDHAILRLRLVQAWG